MAFAESRIEAMLAGELHKRGERSVEESLLLRVLPNEARNGESGPRFRLVL